MSFAEKVKAELTNLGYKVPDQPKPDQSNQNNEKQVELFKMKTGRKQRDKPKRKAQKGKKGMIPTDPLAGCRDFVPEDYIYQEWLFNKWKGVSETFALRQYDCPILEPVDLYKRKAGEEIVAQMYNFKEKSELEVTLRPEMTPSLARLILKQGKKIIFPIKWFSIPQCWRYETTTRGRKREHYQWNVDIWGVPDVTAEAELVAILCTFFESIGLTSTDVKIRFSSRQVLQVLLKKLGVPDDMFQKTCVVVDKLDKLSEEEVGAFMKEIGLEDDVAKEIFKLTKAKSFQDVKELVGEDKALQQIEEFMEYVEGYGFEDWIQFDPAIIRGLSYYTGIVFEAFVQKGELQRAICGGGRYDKLLQTYGSKQGQPAAGFGFGDVVILEILKDLKLLPNLKQQIDDLIIPFSKDYRKQANQTASILRKAGRKVDIFLKNPKKIKQAFSYADRVGADRAIFIAPDEWANGEVRIKNLRASQDAQDKEYNVKLVDLGKQ